MISWHRGKIEKNHGAFWKSRKFESLKFVYKNYKLKFKIYNNPADSSIRHYAFEYPSQIAIEKESAGGAEGRVG